MFTGSFGIELINPRMLGALLLLAPVWMAAARWHSSPRWLLVTALRSLAMTAVILALARPALRLRSDHLTHVVVVDTSASVRDSDLDLARATIRELARSRRPHDRLVVVAVDRAARQVPMHDDGECELRKSTAAPVYESRLSVGLETAAALMERTGSRRATLISDGLETNEGLRLATRQLSAAGIPVDTIPTSTSTASMTMSALSAPAHFTTGERIVLSAQLLATRPVRGTASLLRDGTQLAERTLQVQRGTNRIEFETTMSAGSPGKGAAPARWEIRFRPEGGGDAVASSATLAPGGRVRALLVETDAKRGAALREAMQREGLEVVVRPPGAGFSDLNDFSAVLLGDVSAHDLGVANHAVIRNYVERDGGGLIMLGGERSYGAGGYQKTLVAEALPIEFEQERQEQDPSVALAILLDTSGSMQGMRLQLAKEIAVRAVRHLTPQDRIGVVEFYGSRRWAVPMQRATDLAAVELVLERLRAAGGTVLYGALEEAYYALVNVRARYKHALIISDGDVFPGPFNQLVARMAAEGMTVTTVKVAPEGSSVFLQDIAFHGRGRAFDYSGLTVPDINVKQQSRVPQSPFREQPFKPVVVKRDVELLKGLDWTQAPPLLGYLTVRPHPKAEQILQTATGEPLLARWQFGLGRAIAFTSDARDRWANAWLRWPGFGKFWSQTIRDVARDTALPLRVMTSRDRDATSVRLEAAAPLRDLAARVYTSPIDSSGVRVEQLGTKNHEVRVPHATTTTRTVSFSARTADGIMRSISMVLPSSRQLELRALEPDTELLRAVSEQTGGRFNPSQSELHRHGPGEVVSLEIWHWLLGTSVLTLLFEMLARRWP